MKKHPKYKFIILLLLAAMLVPALVFAQDVDDDDDLEHEVYPCNDHVLAILEAMDRPDDCEYFWSLGVGPGQFKQAWRYARLIDPDATPEMVEEIIAELLAYKDAGFGWGQVKQAAKYASEDVSIEYLLTELRGGDDPVGWGVIKKAQALAESGDYDNSFEDALLALQDSEQSWGELKKAHGLSGPPPWAKGGDKEDEGDSLKENGPGQGNGKAKGHAKNKNKNK